jgi:hypothetical protein
MPTRSVMEAAVPRCRALVTHWSMKQNRHTQHSTRDLCYTPLRYHYLDNEWHCPRCNSVVTGYSVGSQRHGSYVELAAA